MPTGVDKGREDIDVSVDAAVPEGELPGVGSDGALEGVRFDVIAQLSAMNAGSGERVVSPKRLDREIAANRRLFTDGRTLGRRDRGHWRKRREKANKVPTCVRRSRFIQKILGMKLF